MNRNSSIISAQCATKEAYLNAIENGELVALNLMFSDNTKKAEEHIMSLGRSYKESKEILDSVQGVFGLVPKQFAAYVGGNVILVNPLAKTHGLSDDEADRQLIYAFQSFLIAKSVNPELKTWEIESELMGAEYGRETVFAQLELVNQLRNNVPTAAAGNTLHTLIGQFGYKRGIASQIIHDVMRKWGWKEVAERFIQLEA